MIILPVLLGDCPWKAFEWISDTQILPRDGKSVAEDFARTRWHGTPPVGARLRARCNQGPVRANPAIPGLTARIESLSKADWLRVVQKLRDSKLIAYESHHAPETLDAHSLVREHFGEEFQEANHDAWTEAHGRLYEHYKAQVPELPDTLEEMAPLFAAVAHGCQSGRHQ